jgi:hypothetical protein
MTSSARPPMLLLILAAIATLSPACRAIEGIFKAGVGVGFFLAIILVVLVVFGVSKLRG